MSCGQLVLEPRMREHVQGDDRDSERGADPEAPGHVDEFRIDLRLGGDSQRFQRHAADRAAARADLADLWVHRAGVDGARCRRTACPSVPDSFRVGDEFLAAAGASRNGRWLPACSKRWRDVAGSTCHAADGIGGSARVATAGRVVTAFMRGVRRLHVVHGLRHIPHQGMVTRCMRRQSRTVAARLKRIEGQVRGVLRMVEDDRYCVDVLTQIDAVRAALHKVEEQILRDHVSHCVADAFASGDPVEQRHKVEELVETIGRMTR